MSLEIDDFHNKKKNNKMTREDAISTELVKYSQNSLYLQIANCHVISHWEEGDKITTPHV